MEGALFSFSVAVRNFRQVYVNIPLAETIKIWRMALYNLFMLSWLFLFCFVLLEEHIHVMSNE